MITHDEIEERHVAQRYVAGRLSAEEEERFEEHYLHCHECQERLELAESLDRGLKQVAFEEMLVPAVAASAGRLAQRLRMRGWLVAAFLAAALLPAAWLALEVGRLGRALDGAEGTIAELRHGGDGPFEPLVVPLLASRSAAEGTAPEHRVTLPAEARPLLLTLDLGGVETGHYGRFRVTLLGPGGDRRWQRSDLGADDYFEAVVVGLPAASLEEGDYRLRLEGLADAGDAAFLGEYGLRVVRVEKEPRP